MNTAETLDTLQRGIAQLQDYLHQLDPGFFTQQIRLLDRLELTVGDLRTQFEELEEQIEALTTREQTVQVKLIPITASIASELQRVQEGIETILNDFNRQIQAQP